MDIRRVVNVPSAGDTAVTATKASTSRMTTVTRLRTKSKMILIMITFLPISDISPCTLFENGADVPDSNHTLFLRVSVQFLGILLYTFLNRIVYNFYQIVYNFRLPKYAITQALCKKRTVLTS